MEPTVINTVILDIETYFTDDYKIGASITDYIMNPQFEMLAIGVIGLTDAEPTINCDNAEGVLRQIDANKRHTRYVAHNARFDATILKLRYGITLPHVFDLLACARSVYPRQHNDLKSLAARLGLPPKGDTTQFRGVSYRHSLFGMPPSIKAEMVRYLRRDLELERDIYTLLRPQILDTEAELIEHTMSLWLNPKLRFDRERAAALKGKMHGRILSSIPSDIPLAKLTTEIGFKSLLSPALAVSGDSIDNYMKMSNSNVPGVPPKSILALAKTDEARLRLESHQSARVRNLLAARIATKTWPTHIKRIESMGRIAGAFDETFPIPLRYYGAHTGRWSGEEGINPQNFGTRGDPLISEVKNLIKAPSGKTLLIADYASVEARGVAWLADQGDLVEAFRQGRDVYCEFASIAAGFPIRKPIADDPPDKAKLYKWWRGAGKIAVLGCGYMAGAGALLLKAEGQIDLVMATKLVQQYRRTYSRIPRLWNQLERAFTQTFRYGANTRVGPIEFVRKDSNCIDVVLGSGRVLHYTCEMREGVIYVYDAIEDRRIRAHGGYLTENVIQAMARDLMADAILKCEAASLPVVLHVHDSIVCLADISAEGKAKPSDTTILRRCMMEAPTWAAGWPIDVEAEESGVYK